MRPRPVFERRVRLLILLLCVLAPRAAWATERHVPAPYPTIQAAIDVCSDGDVVVVAPGTYDGSGNRDLDFAGRAITVRSSDPNDPNIVAATVIDCEGTASEPHRGFRFDSGEGPNAVVAGLTITDGYGPEETPAGMTDPISVGGAVLCAGASPTLAWCAITGNTAVVGGGILCHDGSHAVISNCLIRGNHALQQGGGTACYLNSNPSIRNCLFVANSSGAMGGAIWADEGANPTVANCTIVDNASVLFDGGISVWEDTMTVTNCILWRNHPDQMDFRSDPNVTFSNVEGGYPGLGNLDVDPCFVDPNGPDGDASAWEDNDYHLTSDSRCIDAGDPNGDYAGQTDIDGEPRVIADEPDMGADERSGPVERHVPGRYATIQAAIDDAGPGDTVIIAPDTYTGDGNRDIKLRGKAITVRSTDPEDPNIVAATVVDAQGTESEWHRGFEIRSHEGPDSVVAGLTITGGWEGYAGGILCFRSGPTITHCVIVGNYTFLDGGGIACLLCEDFQITIANCTIKQNTADARGGGIFAASGAIEIVHCRIVENETTETALPYGGGGVFANQSHHVTIENCTISGNRTVSYGGGIFARFVYQGLTVSNCTIVGNSDSENGGGIHAEYTPVDLTNCIVWGNQPNQIRGSGDLVAAFNDIQGGWAGVGNIDADPLFKDPNGPDGDPNTWQDNDYHLTGSSPCINAGDPNGDYGGQTDIDGQPRVMEDRIDMGSDERPRPTERHVPAQYATVQDAIDVCFDEDQVVLACGTYTGPGNRDLDFRGKGITVRSTDPNDPAVVADTVIDCQGTVVEPHRGFTFRSGEGPDAVVAGLTITNGYGPEDWHKEGYSYPVGGGLFCEGASPTIRQCVLTGNAAIHGGAFWCIDDSNPTVANCVLSGNSAMFGGCAIFDGSPTFVNCLIVGNQASWFAGGLACFAPGRAVIANCTIVDNVCPGFQYTGGGILAADDTVISNCILWGNQPDQIDTDDEPIVTFSDVQGGWPGTGNIGADPLFVDRDGPDGDPDTWQDNDYHVRLGSACVNAGDPNGDYAGQTDIDGERRVMGGRVDMGADEVTYYTWICGDGVGSSLPLAALGLMAFATVSRRRRARAKG